MPGTRSIHSLSEKLQLIRSSEMHSEKAYSPISVIGELSVIRSRLKHILK